MSYTSNGKEQLFSEFLSEWGNKYNQVRQGIKYLRKYPSILKELNLDGLIKPEDLDSYQKDWLWLCSKFQGIERDFFRPYWIPIQTDAYDFFIDLSDSELGIFKTHYFFFEPYQWFRHYFFDSLRELILSTNHTTDYKRIIDEAWVSFDAQVDMLFEERKRMGFE